VGYRAQKNFRQRKGKKPSEEAVLPTEKKKTSTQGLQIKIKGGRKRRREGDRNKTGLHRDDKRPGWSQRKQEKKSGGEGKNYEGSNENQGGTAAQQKK